MSNTVRIWVTLICCAFLFFSVNALLTEERYLTSSYFDSPSFLATKDEFEKGLSQFILHPPNEEMLLRNLTVSDEEIDKHRDFYGSMEAQIDSIEAQYEDLLTEANDVVKQRLITERDAKINDITTNFADDEHVRQKIVADKQEIVRLYMEDFNEERQQFLATYANFAYAFEHVQTGETFESIGSEKVDDIYSASYGGDNRPFSTNHYYVGKGTYTQNATDITFSNNLQTVEQYTGTWRILESPIEDSITALDYQQFQRGKILLWCIVIGGLISGVLLLTIARPVRSDWQQPVYVKDIIQRWPIDVQLVGLAIAVYAVFITASLLLDHLLHTFNLSRFGTIAGFVLESALLLFFTGVILALSGWIFQSISTEKRLRQTIHHSLLYRFLANSGDFFLQRSIAMQTMLLLVCVFMSGAAFIGLMVRGGEFFFFLFFLSFLVGVPSMGLFIMRMGYLNRMMKQTSDWLEGSSKKIPERGHSAFAQHAKHLNDLHEGLQGSQQAQQKSERLKTELISNVSHDLRTPLTSIITYTDLLKLPNLSDEERMKYVDVLEKKSQRLKNLIEDLFEVSKMATGNVELERTRVDLTQLLQQAVAEQQEMLEAAAVECRLTLPNAPVITYIDGQKWWRVLDNLLMNAAKYSLPHTRVYVTLRQTENLHAEITIKNITRYELPEDPNELLERFKRGDASRHTEGSGLGLAIAQSIVDLHDGTMEIDVDGDVFKVTITLPTAY